MQCVVVKLPISRKRRAIYNTAGTLNFTGLTSKDCFMQMYNGGSQETRSSNYCTILQDMWS